MSASTSFRTAPVFRMSLNIIASAIRAFFRMFRPEWNGPFMLTIEADEFPFLHLHVSALYFQGIPVDQGVRYFFSRGRYNITERLAGHLHFPRGIFLVVILKVRETDRFQFVQRQSHYFQFTDRNPGRFEKCRFRMMIDLPAFHRPRHSCLLHNEELLRNVQRDCACTSGL